MTFWVLEDLRCQKWSPTPQYLHVEAGFHEHSGKWYGEIGGGGHLQTPDIHAARKFQTRDEAETFRMSHGGDCGMHTDDWASREHAWVQQAWSSGRTAQQAGADTKSPTAPGIEPEQASETGEQA